MWAGSVRFDELYLSRLTLLAESRVRIWLMAMSLRGEWVKAENLKAETLKWRGGRLKK
jgi:hypothetical protein